jgi:hypothetical protein
MAESPASPSSRKAPSKDELNLLEVLRLLIETEKVKTTSDLLKYASQYGAPEAIERLRMLEAENIPLDLAFDVISSHLRLLAHKRNSTLVAECRGKKVGIILPLPHHLPELFLPVAEVTFLEPSEGAHGPHHEFTDSAVKGTRACRTEAQKMQALVFEAFRENRKLYVDAAIADVLEPKMLPTGILLIAHLRPHQNPGDVQIQPATEVSFI